MQLAFPRGFRRIADLVGLSHDSGTTESEDDQNWHEDHIAYQIWHSKCASLNVNRFIAIFGVFRTLQAWALGRTDLMFVGISLFVSIRVIFAIFRSTCPIAPPMPRLFTGDHMSLMGASKPTPASIMVWKVEVLLAIATTLTLQAFNWCNAMLVGWDKVQRERLFWGGLCMLQLVQPSICYIPRRFYFLIVLPMNAVVFLAFFRSIGDLNDFILLQCALMCFVCGYLFLTKDSMHSATYHAVLETDRQRGKAETESRRAEAWRRAFGGMLDSVFDASCVCGSEGVIESSTPHLDLILLGCDGQALAAGLPGLSLQGFSAGAEEERRMKAFLADIAACGSARKIQLTLSRDAGTAGGCRVPFEASVSGIALPSSGLPGAPGEDVRIFLGLQLTSSCEAIEELVGPPAVPVAAGLKAGGAEEALTSALSPRCSADPVFDGDEVSELASVAAAPPHPRPAPSVCSAPPVLDAATSAASDRCAAGDGDCLPPDAVVWLEGRPAPTRVDAVVQGQRVLCHDHVAGGLKYADVVDLTKTAALETEWVEVVLEDGTDLRMTADHPVYTAGAAAPVKAANLGPSHSLEVLKLVKVQVGAVRCLGAAERTERPAVPTERVSLSVAQPSRHSIFVAAGTGKKQGGVAVASASVHVDQEAAYHRCRVRHTFIDLPGGWELEAGAQRRACSAPGRCRGGRGGQGGQGAAEDVDAEVRSTVSRSTRGGVLPSSRSSCRSSNYSYESSAVSAASLLSSRFVIGHGLAQRDSILHGKQLEQSSIRLLPTLAAKMNGLKSLGSCAHADGKCCPCLMESWHKSGRGRTVEPCHFGAFCGRCHEDHDSKAWTAHRQAMRHRAKKRNRAVT